jgi:helicase
LRFEEVSIPSELLGFLRGKGLEELYPPQELAIRNGLLEGKNLVISSPTASGKTLIAMIAAYCKVKLERKKVVYLTPLRALAFEKYSEFSELKGTGIRTTISTGDYDSSGEQLGRADIVVTTNERFDSLMRHRTSWLDNVGLYIADEIHLAGSDSRGPTLEMILTKILHSKVRAQILALSATISNGQEIARWLESELLEVNWRPVPLLEGVYQHGRIKWSNGEERIIEPSRLGPAIDVSINAVIEGGQALIFAGTRRRAVSLAKSAAEALSSLIRGVERSALREAATRIRNAGEETSLSRMLADFVSKGSAFHHAGLVSEHRRIVEDYFRAGHIKILAATPTLAAGVNLPARRVVIADITRYDTGSGISENIPVLEYKQMAGRAGRPQFDSFGETVIIAPHSQEVEDIIEYYIKGKPESIVSRLSEQGAFRFHLLATIASGTGVTYSELEDIFGRTLLAMQSGSGIVRRMINSCSSFLLEEGLVKKTSDIYYATEFGKRASMLYIDPLTAVIFRDAVRKMEHEKDYTAGILHVIAGTPDFEPKFPLREKDYEPAIQFFEEHRGEMIVNKNRTFAEFDNAISKMRSTMILYAWIDEWKEEEILEKLGVEPGDLHRAKENADWLLYSFGEIAKLFGRKDAADRTEILRKRVQQGVAEELLELTSLEGIGRVRARALYAAGFKTLDDLKEASAERLATVGKIGQALARKIKEQVGS